MVEIEEEGTGSWQGAWRGLGDSCVTNESYASRTGTRGSGELYGRELKHEGNA